MHDLHNSSVQLANKLQSEDDSFYVRQRICERKNNLQPNIESGGIHNTIESNIDIGTS